MNRRRTLSAILAAILCGGLFFTGLQVLRAQEAQTQQKRVTQNPRPDPYKEDPRFFNTFMEEKAPFFDDSPYYDKLDPGDRKPDQFTWFRDDQVPKSKDMIGQTNSPVLMTDVLCYNHYVKAGDTVRFTAIVDDASIVAPTTLGFELPGGRNGRSSVEARFVNTTNHPGVQVLSGEIKVNPWAESGFYKPNFMDTSTEMGMTKSYMHDTNGGKFKNAWFYVEPNPNADTEHPRITRFSLFDPNQTPAAKTININDSISIYLKGEDNRSGVVRADVYLEGPAGPRSKRKHMIVALEKTDDPNSFVANFKLNPWYESGDYYVTGVRIQDGAGNSTNMFGATDALAKTARFKVVNQKPDVKAPELVNFAVSTHTARVGEEVKIRAVVIDDLSGVENVVVRFYSPHWIHSKRVFLKRPPKAPVTIKQGMDVETNVFEGVLKLDPLNEPGEWRLSRLSANDNANNYLNLEYETYVPFKDFKITFASDRKPGPVIGELLNATGGTVNTAPVAPATAGGAQPPAKIRRVDMIPPHPPRGACLNCHEP